MPLVEVLPNSASAAAPGWTYVVDTGYDPSKVAINPKDRKRAAARPGGPRGENELSARQQTAIARRIADLEKDNDPGKSIPVPGKGATPKTQNARRIIQYQRQIKHWLDDEEALLQQAPPPRPVAATGRAAPRDARRQSRISVPPTPMETTPAPSTFGSNLSTEPVDPLLSIDNLMPPPVNPAELEALLTAPPLLYGASHAAGSAMGAPPQRKFCDTCGYWGKIKCLKCGARICGMPCKEAHEDPGNGRCLRWG